MLARNNHHSRLEAKATAAWTSPSPGDQVFVTDRLGISSMGGMDLRWLGPRLLISLSGSGVSSYVQELHGDRVKGYRLDDPKTCCPRKRLSGAVTVERGAMVRVSFIGQRVMDHHTPPYFS